MVVLLGEFTSGPSAEPSKQRTPALQRGRKENQSLCKWNKVLSLLGIEPNWQRRCFIKNVCVDAQSNTLLPKQMTEITYTWVKQWKDQKKIWKVQVQVLDYYSVVKKVDEA